MIDVCEIVNSDEIKGRLIGAKITGFQLNPIKGKKSIYELIIETDLPFSPLLTLGNVLNHADCRFFKIKKRNNTDFGYSLRTIRLRVKVQEKIPISKGGNKK